MAGPTERDGPDAPPVSVGLTTRQREVIRLLAEGKTDRQIADDLCLSYRTVTTHVGRLLAKLALPSRAAVAAWAVRHGLD